MKKLISMVVIIAILIVIANPKQTRMIMKRLTNTYISMTYQNTNVLIDKYFG